MPAIRKESISLEEYKYIKEPSLIFQSRVNTVNHNSTPNNALYEKKNSFEENKGFYQKKSKNSFDFLKCKLK